VKIQTAIFLRLENFRGLILLGLTWNSNSRFAIRNSGDFRGFVSPTLLGAWARNRGASCSSLIVPAVKSFQLIVKRHKVNSKVIICQAKSARWRENGIPPVPSAGSVQDEKTRPRWA